MNAMLPFQKPPPIVPKKHQLDTLEFLLAHKRAFNLSDCGTGKTLPAVQAVQMLVDGGYLQRVLVVAPLSVIRATWQEHFAQFAPHITVTLLDEAPKRRKLVEDIPNGVAVINPDGIKSVFHELADWTPQLIIIDELSGYYRNCRTQRWKALKALDALCKPAMWAFTGTPITKSLMDSYAQIQMVNPSALPRAAASGRTVSWLNYRDMLHKQPYPNVWVPKDGALERVFGFMQPAVRFRRADVMKEVKEPIRLRKDIPLTPDQSRLMKELQDKGRTQYGTSVIKGAEAAALVTKVVQIMSGSVYDGAGNAVAVPAEPRIEAMFDLFNEVGQSPLIVCAPFVHTINALKQEIAGRGHTVEVIYGDVKMEERAEIVRRFQAGKIDFLVCHPKTMAHGITLTASHTVLWFAPLYDLELYAQANARIERYGQEGQPLVVEFCSAPIEAKIYAALRSKEKLSGTFLSLFK